MVDPNDRALRPPIPRSWLRLRLGKAYYSGRRHLLWLSPRFHWARRRQAGMTVEQIAGELGLPMSAARSVCRSVRTAPKVPDTATGNTIGANLDAQTYLALQRLVTCPAGGEGA